MANYTMPLTAHLGELRKRIIISLIAVTVTFVIAFNYSEDIFRFIMFPLKYSLDFSVKKLFFHFVPQDKLHNTKLVFLAPAEAFLDEPESRFCSRVYVGFAGNFSPALAIYISRTSSKGKKICPPIYFVCNSSFSLQGRAFCFFIVLPFAMGFLLTYKVGDFLMPMLSVGQYVDFCLKFILAFGIIFELPIAIIFLTKMGIVTPKGLARNRKYAVLFAFIAGAILTPTPDAFNQTLMAVPIILLYEVGIWISPLFVKKNGTAET